MKIRKDFVSNSSSSSFIVINDAGGSITRDDVLNRLDTSVVTVPAPEFGECEFGWQTCKYNDFWSKLNWCAIVVREQISEDKRLEVDGVFKKEISEPWYFGREMLKLLQKVCSDDFGLDIVLNDATDEYGDGIGYIDHQSNIYETPENKRMFRSEKTLRDFLTNESSYIDNSNDNGGRDDQYDDEYRLIIPGDYEKPH